MLLLLGKALCGMCAVIAASKTQGDTAAPPAQLDAGIVGLTWTRVCVATPIVTQTIIGCIYFYMHTK